MICLYPFMWGRLYRGVVLRGGLWCLCSVYSVLWLCSVIPLFFFCVSSAYVANCLLVGEGQILYGHCAEGGDIHAER